MNRFDNSTAEAALAAFARKFRASILSRVSGVSGVSGVSSGDVQEIFSFIIEDLHSEDLSSVSSDVGTFSQLQTAIFSSVLQESLDKIKILGLIGGLPSVKTNIEYQSLKDKYEKEDTQSFIFDPETLECFEGSLNKQMLIKFQKDRSYIEQILSETYDDLLTNYSVNIFFKRLNEFGVLDQEKTRLLKDTAENLAKVKKLSAQLEKDRANLTNSLQTKSEILGKLKDEYEDLIYENDIKYKYIERWETARQVQNLVVLDKKEEYYNNIIREYVNNYQREHRVSTEIQSFLIETQDTHLSDIEKWMEKYDKDLEQKDNEIQIMKEKREEQFTRLENLTKMYEQHKQEIATYLEEREERRQEEILLEQLNKAATKIQAWWRGTMYRKCLGPYRKRKAKKNGKKKGK